MKIISSTILFAFLGLSTFSSSQDCTEIESLLKEYESTTFVDETAEIAKTELVFLGLEFLVKKSLKILSATYDLLDPTVADTPLSAYANSVKKIDVLIQETYVDLEQLGKEVENLNISGSGIRTNLEFGNNSACYDAIDDLTEEMHALFNEIKKDQTKSECIYEEFQPTKVNIGTRCGKETSVEAVYTNTLNQPIRLYCSFQNQDGTWRKWSYDGTFGKGIPPGETKTWYTCNGTGSVQIIGVVLHENNNDKDCPAPFQQRVD